MRLLIAFVLMIGIGHAARAATYYVSGAGSDAANGLSAKSAFRTLQHAADLTQPGDTVYAMDGTYSAAATAYGGDVLSITRSGAAGKWIRYDAYPGQHPHVVTRGWDGIRFGPKVSYVELRGFTVTGNNNNIDRAAAIKRGDVPKPKPDPAYDGNCISIDGREGTAAERPHHIRILNNTISKCGGGGVSSIQADYVTISGNSISDCSWYSIYGTSGISTLESWNSDDKPGDKMVITHNKLVNNKELVWWVSQGKITDGEAIIIDTLRSPMLGPYKGRTLVAGNVIYGNGSSAVEVFRSDHVDVFNNSTYANVTNPEETGRGELDLNDAGDVHVLNNIFVSAKGQNPVTMDTNRPCDCSFGSNIYFGGENIPPRLMGPADLFADPQYRNVDLAHSETVDLRVADKSPAKHSGVKTIAKLPDDAGKAQAAATGSDRGAFQQ